MEFEKRLVESEMKAAREQEEARRIEKERERKELARVREELVKEAVGRTEEGILFFRNTSFLSLGGHAAPCLSFSPSVSQVVSCAPGGITSSVTNWQRTAQTFSCG